MYQAVTTLRMLNTLTAHPEVQRSFLAQPILGRAANAVRKLWIRVHVYVCCGALGCRGVWVL